MWWGCPAWSPCASIVPSISQGLKRSSQGFSVPNLPLIFISPFPFHYFQGYSYFSTFSFTRLFFILDQYFCFVMLQVHSCLWQLWISPRFCPKHSKSAAACTYSEAVVICCLLQGNVEVMQCNHSGYPPITWASPVWLSFKKLPYPNRILQYWGLKFSELFFLP